MGRPARPVLATLAALLVAALPVAGCVSMPSGGPVQSYPVTQGADAPNEQFAQIQPKPPGAGWSPSQVVQGFLTASASFGSYGEVVQQYLTPAEQENWKTYWSAVVFKSGPKVTPPTYPAEVKNPTSATVSVTGVVQASLKGSGSYSVPSAQGSAPSVPEYQFTLQKVHGQWRISDAPPVLLLTSNSFAHDYQLRNLYFFDPMGRYLVPDPVYVPVGATPEDLVNGLVGDLIKPPGDWLTAGATKTAFPSGTKISNVTLDGGTAVVNLTGTIAKSSESAMNQVSAQLLSTLSVTAQDGPSGQSVQSVEILVNGKPWIPPGNHGNPVQPKATYAAPLGKSGKFYYIDSAGYLDSRQNTGGQSDKLAKIGTGYSSIAVSRDGSYVAALRGNVLYAGLVGKPLVSRGTGYMAMSWDVNDDLWASAGTRIVMFRGSNSRQPLGQMVQVDVENPSTPFIPLTPFTQLQVAPDGVRVAIVQDGGDLLTFGAISGQQSLHPRISLSSVQDSPLAPAQPSTADVKFTALSWYGPKDVITLAQPGPTVTDYPVSGGSPITIPNVPGMQTISVSYDQPLVAGLSKKRMVTEPSPTGAWMPLEAEGTSPVYPG